MGYEPVHCATAFSSVFVPCLILVCPEIDPRGENTQKGETTEDTEAAGDAADRGHSGFSRYSVIRHSEFRSVFLPLLTCIIP